ncbi:MAG: SRPBCC family protein [Acidimicrobiia bacterium]|nr:SRPBCC family protein [Acidimicrobiia bacterium]
MRTSEVSREVGAPAETVWQVMTDLENSPHVISAIERVERLDGNEGFGVGTRWRETRTMFGKQATEEMEVTAVTPGRSYTVEAESRGARYVSTLGVEPLATDRSQVSMAFGAEPQGVLAKVFSATVGRLFDGATRKALESDLDDIASAAERRS